MWNTLVIEPFVNLMLLIYSLLGGNLFFAIVLITILVRAALIPLSQQQTKSARKMQELQPQLKEIQEKYRDNPEKMQQEMIRIGYNPVSVLGGCLLTFIQFPIWIGLYQSIIRAVPSVPTEMLNLYNAHYGFLFPNFDRLIPIASQFLWMDLGRPERIPLEWLPIPLAVLPFLVLVTTWLQQQMMTPPPSGDANDTQAQMMKSMQITMPLMLFVFSFQYAAGLSVYFIVSNTIGAIQFAYTNRDKLEWRPTFVPFLRIPALAAAPAAAVSGRATTSSRPSAPAKPQPKEKETPRDEVLPTRSRRKKATVANPEPTQSPEQSSKSTVRARSRRRN